MGEEQDVAAHPADSGDQPVNAPGDIGGGFSTRAAVGPQRPARLFGGDLRRGLALVPAVIPFGQIRPKLDDVAVAGEPACIQGPLQRAAQDERKRPARQL